MYFTDKLIKNLRYVGPADFEGNLDTKDAVRKSGQSYPKFVSLKGLVSISGDFTMTAINRKIKILEDLETVGGSVFLERSGIEKLPKLKTIGGDLYVGGLDLKILPALENLGRILHIGEEEAIPLLPKLRGDCSIMVGHKWFLGTYKDQVRAVQKIPVLDLVPTRQKKRQEVYRNIIDARLKGIIK